MDRKTFKQIQQDKIDEIMNGQELAATMAQMEIDMFELAHTIDNCKNKKRKAKLNKRLNILIQTVSTVSGGNISLINH